MLLGASDSPVSWATKTYSEIHDVGDCDGSIAVVPVGSIEQHGNHLPVATDSILATAVGTEGAERVADDMPVLVTPAVWTGYSPHHLLFGGTVTVEHETYPYDDASVDLFETGPFSVYRPFDAYSESGAIGAPELASAEKGARLYDGLADELADLLRDVHRTAATE